MKVLLITVAVVFAFAMNHTYAEYSMRFEPGSGDVNCASLEAFANFYDYRGQKVTVAGPFLSSAADAFEAVLQHFVKATGA